MCKYTPSQRPRESLNAEYVSNNAQRIQNIAYTLYGPLCCISDQARVTEITCKVYALWQSKAEGKSGPLCQGPYPELN